MIRKFQDYEPQIGNDTFIAENAVVIGNVEIGDWSNIWFSAVIRGEIHPIKIGKATNIQDNCTVHISHIGPTLIGDYVTVGHNSIVHGCTIEDECLIGMGAIIMDQAYVGRQSIIGAGAMVPKGMKIPERSLVYGVPAKIIRQLTDEEIAGIRESADDYIERSSWYK